MKRIVIVFFIAVAVFLSACRSLNPSVMLKTGKDFKYNTFSTEPPAVYKISKNDELSFNIYTNDGFKLVDLTTLLGEQSTTTTGGGGTRTVKSSLTYKVEFDGAVKFPVLGRINLQGMTVREAESFLEEKYSAFYNKPFVLLEVTNRRVIIFPGAAGAALVVPLQNENTTLMEGLASAGGISENGKAYKVKLIRGNLKDPEVYLIDLSTLDGVKKANLILQANDIIYVEPHLRIGKEVMANILPYLSFITTTILFIELIKKTP
ncbi:MAG: polysaccharide biosynthesis/export family protein [Bacteroidetes bacterium]|nr:polysaccharide biosynthesis/export family protein [Bacteroidota bacterium]